MRTGVRIEAGGWRREPQKGRFYGGPSRDCRGGLGTGTTKSENLALAQVTHDKAMDECTLHLSLSETLDGEDGSGLLFGSGTLRV